MIRPAAAVVDTNVLVAGLLSFRAASPVARVLDGMLSAAFPYVLSRELLREYGSVLARPGLQKRHGLTPAEIEILLTDLAQNAIVLGPVAGPPAPEPGDQLLWNLLAAKPDLLLVTGDKLLLEDESMRGRVLTPKAFLAKA
ncbi:MAG TPA: PIN domain-containing protein [Burkholderiales bacterium]|nr:PIN domain-containing protein [Burkholderiales bacterium]